VVEAIDCEELSMATSHVPNEGKLLRYLLAPWLIRLAPDDTQVFQVVDFADNSIVTEFAKIPEGTQVLRAMHSGDCGLYWQRDCDCQPSMSLTWKMRWLRIAQN
jgi:hypothetical protein